MNQFWGLAAAAAATTAAAAAAAGHLQQSCALQYQADLQVFGILKL